MGGMKWSCGICVMKGDSLSALVFVAGGVLILCNDGPLPGWGGTRFEMGRTAGGFLSLSLCCWEI